MGTTRTHKVDEALLLLARHTTYMDACVKKQKKRSKDQGAEGSMDHDWLLLSVTSNAYTSFDSYVFSKLGMDDQRIPGACTEAKV